MGAPGTPRREVVTGAPRASHRPARPVRVHAADPAADPLAVQALMRRQLRLGAMVFSVLAGGTGLLPLAFSALPDPAVRPGSALIVWAVLGVAVYPALVVLGRWYVVRAERVERDTAADLERS
ncbi:hypothetical protein ACH5A3_07830 [Streptomyces echinatus]|uniref:hypothetical protein n=1 Tax=Streptomyces echinatus TaxID=67293 RepID=UPI0037A36DCC